MSDKIKKKLILFIGPPRSGTTHIDLILRQNPIFTLPPMKETRFLFQDEKKISIDKYLSLFDLSREYILEIEPNYINHPELLLPLKKYFTDITLVIVIRDIIDRYQSLFQLKKMYNQKLEINIEDEIIISNKIEFILNNFKTFFLDFNLLKDNPKSFFKKFHKLINIQDFNYSFENIFKKDSREPKNNILISIAMKMQKYLRKFNLHFVANFTKSSKIVDNILYNKKIEHFTLEEKVLEILKKENKEIRKYLK